MYRNIHLRVVMALGVIICLSFSQVAAAAFACPTLADSGAAETASQGTDRADNSDDPCTEHDAVRLGLCLAHCNPTALSVNHAQADTPQVMLVALHWLPDGWESAALVSTAPPLDLPLRSRSPPLSILHCCFRI